MEPQELLNCILIDLGLFGKTLPFLSARLGLPHGVEARIYDLVQAVLEMPLYFMCNREAVLDGRAGPADLHGGASLRCR